jgi:hypothetical protein
LKCQKTEAAADVVVAVAEDAEMAAVAADVDVQMIDVAKDALAIEVTENQDVRMILVIEATDVADVLTMINQEEDAQKTLTLAILVRIDQDVLEEEINYIIKSSEFYSGLFLALKKNTKSDLASKIGVNITSN